MNHLDTSEISATYSNHTGRQTINPVEWQAEWTSAKDSRRALKWIRSTSFYF